MRIIVPSLGRAGTAASMKWLPKCNRPITFAVHSDEVGAYALAYPETEIMVLSDDCRRHTGKVRKEIMQRIREPFIFVDDDIRVNLKTVNNHEQMIDVLEEHLRSGFSMAGITQQLYYDISKTTKVGNDPYAVRNKFVAIVYGINPTHFDTCPLEQLPVYEDVALIIHAIKNGGGTVVSYVAAHSNVTPPEGGCNSWRNAQITLDCLETIVKLYPDVCSIRETEHTTHSQYLGVGLRVAWSQIKKVQ